MYGGWRSNEEEYVVSYGGMSCFMAATVKALLRLSMNCICSSGLYVCGVCATKWVGVSGGSRRMKKRNYQTSGLGEGFEE